MKCPKCAYLGFDTGDRCRNCGYDFSLMAAPPADAVGELPLRTDTESGQAAAASLADATLGFEPAVPPTSFRGEPALPLFGRSATGEDEPLIKVPAQPRRPLSVRRTPETPRSRPAPKAVTSRREGPELDFADAPAAPPSRPPSPVPVGREPSPATVAPETSGAGLRVLAAVVDHAILLTIDVTVVYLSLRVVSLTMDEWAALPMLPMLVFLGLVKLAYFTAFTYVGGQTIGKMATGIRVVGEDYRALDAPHALHRALAGAVSFLTLGAGFIPAVLGPDRRALHDRLAHTRVVVVPGA